jgi:hypothetical protein
VRLASRPDANDLGREVGGPSAFRFRAQGVKEFRNNRMRAVAGCGLRYLGMECLDVAQQRAKRSMLVEQPLQPGRRHLPGAALHLHHGLGGRAVARLAG